MRWAFTLSICLGLAAPAVAQPAAVDLDAVTLEDGAGEWTVLGDLVDGPTVLHFWATWCGPCREELPELEEFAVALEPGRLVLVSVDTVDIERVGAFLDELGVGLASYRQAEGNVGSTFAILGYPSTIVVDAAGVVLWRRQGAVAWEDGEGDELVAEMAKVGEGGGAEL